MDNIFRIITITLLCLLFVVSCNDQEAHKTETANAFDKEMSDSEIKLKSNLKHISVEEPQGLEVKAIVIKDNTDANQ